MNLVTDLLISMNLKSDSYNLILVIIFKLIKIVKYKFVKMIIHAAALVNIIIDIILRNFSFLDFIIKNKNALWMSKF